MRLSLIHIFISPKELKKDDVAVVHSYGKQFAIGTVLEPVSELEALTGHQRKCIEDVICLVDVTNYLKKQQALSERSKLEELMDEKMAELKYEDQLKKTADRLSLIHIFMLDKPQMIVDTTMPDMVFSGMTLQGDSYV